MRESGRVSEGWTYPLTSTAMRGRFFFPPDDIVSLAYLWIESKCWCEMEDEEEELSLLE